MKGGISIFILFIYIRSGITMVFNGFNVSLFSCFMN